MAEFWLFACPTTRADEEERLEGRDSENVRLSEKGLWEARRIAVFLSRENIASIWCSTSAATWEVAGMTQIEYGKFQNTNITIFGFKELEEIDFGAANGLSAREADEIYPRSMTAWKNGSIEDDIPLFIGAENPLRAAHRLRTVLSYVATSASGSPHKKSVILSHRYIISLVLAHNKGTPLSHALKLPVPAGSLSVIIRDRNTGMYWTEKRGSVEHLTGTP